MATFYRKIKKNTNTITTKSKYSCKNKEVLLAVNKKSTTEARLRGYSIKTTKKQSAYRHRQPKQVRSSLTTFQGSINYRSGLVIPHYSVFVQNV